MSFKGLKPITYGGREVWPLIEGGKGVSATNHASSGVTVKLRIVVTLDGVGTITTGRAAELLNFINRI